jgi:hypothetical protein
MKTRKQIYKGYTIKEVREKLAGGFFVQITYAVFKDNIKICDVVDFEWGRKKIDEILLNYVPTKTLKEKLKLEKLTKEGI